MTHLEQLLNQYPLPDGWEKPEICESQIDLNGLKVHLIGLTSHSNQYGEMVASAGQTGSQPPLIRAYFELIERTCTLEFEKNKNLDSHVATMDSEGKFLEFKKLSLLTPQPHSTEDWIYSKSNGVAAHTNIKTALKKSHSELVERDQILRSWFGNSHATELKMVDFETNDFLKKYYTLSVWDFGNNVVGIFGFPLNEKIPFFMGFGCDQNSIDEAYHHALQEGLQRMGFLWNEEIPLESPAHSNTTIFHMDYYLCPKNFHKIKDWLYPSHSTNVQKVLNNRTDPTFINITPENRKNFYSVVKAIDSNALPLTFGLGNPMYPKHSIPELRWVHPVA